MTRRERERRRVQVGLVVLAAIIGLAALLDGRVGRSATRQGHTLGTSPTATPPAGVAFFPAEAAGATGTAGIGAAIPSDPPLPPALVAAQQASDEGRYEDAIARYRPQAAAGGAIGAAAQWGWAVNLFAAGQFDAAIKQFAAYAHDYPNSPHHAEAAFWAGRAHLAAGRPAAAAAEFVSYAAVGGPLRATALTLAAAAQQAAGDPAQARVLLQQALAASTTRLDRVAATARLAELAAANGAPAEAAAWYAQVATDAQIPMYKAEMLDKAGAALIQAGQTAAGEARLRDLIRDLPDQPAAYSALQRLLDRHPTLLADGSVDGSSACRVAYAAGHAQEAIGYCDAYRAAQPTGAARADAAWTTAHAYATLENWTQAAVWYQGFAEVYPRDPRVPAALLGWAAAVAAGGDPDTALTLYERLIATYPQSTAAAAAADAAGVLLRRAGNLAAAADHWAGAATAPGADEAQRARAGFWRGWALQQQGQAGAAAGIWQGCAPLPTFWGARCADHLTAARLIPRDPGPTPLPFSLLPPPPTPPLKGEGRQTPPASVGEGAGGSSQSAADETALLQWAATWGKPAGEPPTAGTVPPRLATDPAYRRALALVQVGLEGEAMQAFTDLATGMQTAGDGVGLATMALATQHGGRPWLALPITQRLQAAATTAGQAAGPLDLPRAAQALLFPVAWPHAVNAAATEQSVDPWLLLALVRQESAYNPRARSGADARGLTQVVPATAAGIAAALHSPSFDVASLDRPALSLRFGAVYLHDTLARFDGNILYALAGYNAGPGNVPDWAGGRVAGDPDLFIDNIPYPETREYVQLVYRNYALYRRLYNGE